MAKWEKAKDEHGVWRWTTEETKDGMVKMMDLFHDHWDEPLYADMQENWHVKRDGNYILLGHGKGKEYEIPLSHLETQREFLNWLGQIMEKNWCTPALLFNFLHLVSAIRGDFRGDWEERDRPRHADHD